MKPTSRVDFLCIGAPRAGTTWLHRRLREHPDFSLPLRKEIHYFDRDPKYTSPNVLSESSLLRRLHSWDWNKEALRKCFNAVKKADLPALKWNLKWHFSDYTDQWYLSLFGGAGDRITGDITPAYSILEEADIRKMVDLLPNAKIVFLLRNPIERDWSSYQKYSAKYGALPNDKEIIQFLTSPAITERSNYLQTLERYSRHFPLENILIGFFDAMVEQPLTYLSEIVSFLGGSPTKIEQGKKLQTKNNKSPATEASQEVRFFLKERHRAKIAAMSEQWGNYCTAWYHDLEGKPSPTVDLQATLRLS